MEHRVDQLNLTVLGSVRQWLGAEDEIDTCKDDIINMMTCDEIFDAWCNFEGYINSSNELKSVIENIWQIEGGLKEV